jgi:hypothetical protein
MAAGGKEERGRRWDLVTSSRKKGFHRGSLHRGRCRLASETFCDTTATASWQASESGVQKLLHQEGDGEEKMFTSIFKSGLTLLHTEEEGAHAMI